MGSVLHFSEHMCFWSMFVRLTELTVAWSVHLRPGCRDYSVSLFIKPEPFIPAGLVLCAALLCERAPNLSFCLCIWCVYHSLHNMQECYIKITYITKFSKFRWEIGITWSFYNLVIKGNVSVHALPMFLWVSCECCGFLLPILLSFLWFYVYCCPSSWLRFWHQKWSWKKLCCGCLLLLNSQGGSTAEDGFPQKIDEVT